MLAELEGGGECGRAAGLPGCIPVVDTQLLPCSSPSGLLDFHGQRTPPFPLSVLMGFIPWVHVLMLAFFLSFEMPVLLGIPFAEGHP